MHPVHFRYVTEAPSGQTCNRLFQLMDDQEPVGLAAVLRDAYVSLNVFCDSPLEAYTEFKRRLVILARISPDESLIVFGMVSYILSGVLARSSDRIFRFVESKRQLAAISPDEAASIVALREEEHLLRVAYKSFCELVVSALLSDHDPGIDFGHEYLLEDAKRARESPRVETLSPEQLYLKDLSRKLFPESSNK